MATETSYSWSESQDNQGDTVFLKYTKKDTDWIGYYNDFVVVRVCPLFSDQEGKHIASPQPKF